MSITEIVKAASIHRNTVARYLDILLVSGQVEMHRFGMAKIYTLSQSVPLSVVLSISSELVLQLDTNLRVIFINEPFLDLIGTDEKDLLGKNIVYTPLAAVFEDTFPFFIGKIRGGLNGKEWSGEIAIDAKYAIFFCKIAPTAFDDGRKVVSVILEDITSRKKAEQQVEESERQFRLLAENSLDMIGRFKPDYTHLYVSPAYTTSLGYLPEELIGKSWEIFIHPEDVQSMESIGKNFTPQNSSATFRGRAKHKDGHYIWLESRVRAIFDEKTLELSEYYAVTRDITDRKKAEQEIAESEDRYRTLVEISPDAVVIQQQGKFIFVNPAALKLYGALHPAELIGKNVIDFIQPEFRMGVRKNIEKDLNGEITPPMELHILRIDGTAVFVECRGVKTSINGEPAIQLALRDITEQKRSINALRESEATARALINALTDSVILMDTQGVILALNEAAAARLGRRVDKLIGVLTDNLLPIEIAQSRRFLISKVLEKKKMVRFEDERDGRWYDTVAYPIMSESGEVTRITVIARDITDRRNTEEALIKSEHRFRYLITAIGDIAWETDAQARFVYVSPQVETILGYKPDELIGHTPFEFLHPDTIPLNQKKFQTAAERQEKSVLHESYWIHKDGHLVTIESNAIPMYDSNGSFSGFIGIDRKR